MRTRSLLWILLAAGWLGTGAQAADKAPAQKPFSGEDAAYVDWAWKNCNVVATAAERSMVEKASGVGSDAFQRSYEQQYRKIIDQARDASATKKLCATISDLYGSSGSRFENMIAAPGTDTTTRGTPVPSSRSDSSAGGTGGGGRRGGGGGGRRGGM